MEVKVPGLTGKDLTETLDSGIISSESNSAKKRLRVLVIDDETSVRFIARKALESGGIEVTEADDGLHALSILESGSFDVIICDLMMPRLDGRGFIEQFRAKYQSTFTPILLVTAIADISTKVSLLELGGDDYLIKPYHHRELLARVRVLARLKDMTEALREESNLLRKSKDQILVLQNELLRNERASTMLTLTRSAFHIVRQPLSAAMLLSSTIFDKLSSGAEVGLDKFEKLAEYLSELERAVASIEHLDVENKDNYAGGHSIFKIREHK
ncbi:MAG TPA: response regulator transcription factor [Oligoflexia bacterium]|nr:response regulator transcription factor [Oligoflexia bacterium]HMP48793.1 response regulator transcription factor [Oligoflexia bacterium]